ncbi:hypothetical protein DUNSADRAFT_9243 [Dunaliella salina]|uniref:Encoded protein n=1 Tax=Dunaliella salina TaxID=3046 RepID=A0ABQ7GHT3_DUNSA|nr:hypothetical protein DUNSADRAFT_9243 [Dunaliella salina]|eukprot:KAF5834168.1 hypothetical protein DUNSADRAFT_9243 [Dunaliella salina]
MRSAAAVRGSDGSALEPFQGKLLLRNFDEPGSEPMSFQVANLATFAIKDILLNPNMVKVLGLAGTTALNYAQDDRAPFLQACKEDFIYINGQRLDATFVKAADANLKLSPADGTHYEIQARKGLLDTVAYHPGSTSHNDHANELLTLGVGNLTVPSRLGPGETWESELVVRWFNQYWNRPPFENDMLPMPALRRQVRTMLVMLFPTSAVDVIVAGKREDVDSALGMKGCSCLHCREIKLQEGLRCYKEERLSAVFTRVTRVLQPKNLAYWLLVKRPQPESKIETSSDKKIENLYIA